jgi:hypothetical protein
LWGSLTAEGGKDDIRRRRDESIRRAHEREAAAAAARVKRKQQEERWAPNPCVPPLRYERLYRLLLVRAVAGGVSCFKRPLNSREENIAIPVESMHVSHVTLHP